DRPMTAAVARRRLPDDLPERPAEGPEAGEADVEADVGDAAVGLPQQEHRALYPPPLQVAVRRLAEHGAEAAAEVRRGDVGYRRDGTKVERLGVGAVHRIAGAEQGPVQILDLSAHAAMLGTSRGGRHAKSGWGTTGSPRRGVLAGPRLR